MPASTVAKRADRDELPYLPVLRKLCKRLNLPDKTIVFTRTKCVNLSASTYPTYPDSRNGQGRLPWSAAPALINDRMAPGEIRRQALDKPKPIVD